MRRCEDEKMRYRPPLLEEPCAQTLSGKKTQNPLAKAGPFTLESDVCVKALKCKDFQIIRCLIKPLLKNSIQTIFQGVPHEWLSYSII